MSAILIVDSVSRSFDGRAVLDGASLRAVPGELRALVGANGGGKSTLLKIGAGIIPPDGGSVYFTGRTYQTMLRAHLAALGMFYIPDRDLLSNAWSVRNQLDMIRQQFNGGDPEEAVETVGISQHIDKYPHSLSPGERRRAEIAAALVRRPRCILADEPYRGLAPKDAADITHVFRALAASGVAVVISGHEMPELLAAADRVTWCTCGRTQEMGPPYAAARSAQYRRECLGELAGTGSRVASSAS